MSAQPTPITPFHDLAQQGTRTASLNDLLDDALMGNDRLPTLEAKVRALIEDRDGWRKAFIDLARSERRAA